MPRPQTRTAPVSRGHASHIPANLPQVSYETITPAIAREFLRHNVSNRPLRRSRVDELRAMFERGEYKVTHQGVAFGKDGVMQDGQHRLSALAEMPESFSVVMQVTRGLDKSAYSVHDMGAKRSYSEALQISRGLAEVARFMASIVSGTGSASPQFLKTYVDFLQPYYEQLLEDTTAKRRTWSSASVRSAAIVRLAQGVDANYVRDIYRALVTSDFNAMPPIAQAVFRAELNGRVKAQEKNDMFARALKIFDPESADQTKVQINDASARIAEVREFVSEALSHGRRRNV
jgi:hypothetical protein